MTKIELKLSREQIHELYSALMLVGINAANNPYAPLVSYAIAHDQPKILTALVRNHGRQQGRMYRVLVPYHYAQVAHTHLASNRVTAYAQLLLGALDAAITNYQFN